MLKHDILWKEFMDHVQACELCKTGIQCVVGKYTGDRWYHSQREWERQQQAIDFAEMEIEGTAAWPEDDYDDRPWVPEI